MNLWLYRTLTTALGPVIRLYLRARRRRGKEDSVRYRERLGVAGRARPNGPLIWMHAASVGESLALLSVIGGLRSRFPEIQLLLTTGTVTSARIMEARLPDGVMHQYVPVDRLAYVRRFLGHWQPDLAIWSESEFWPNLLTVTQQRRVPLVLVQGRVSPGTFARWKRHPRLIHTMLGGFDLCLAQTPADAGRLSALGAPRVECSGNLKFAAAPLPADPADLAEAMGQIGGRPFWLAASTHPGEEQAIARVHQRIAPALPGLLTIIVPRHPERGKAISEAIGTLGLKAGRRSAQQAPDREIDIYVADTLGELGLFYRLAPLVFMGKSLVGEGGQNPLEPARLDCALLYGPHMDNFADIALRLEAAGGARSVADEEALAGDVERLLKNPDAATAMARAAADTASEEAHVLDRVIEALDPFCRQIRGGSTGR